MDRFNKKVWKNWDKTEYRIKAKNDSKDDYDEKYLKIKIDSDDDGDDLPSELQKTLQKCIMWQYLFENENKYSLHVF